MTLLLILLIALIIGLILFWTIRNGIGPTPTSPKAKRVIIKYLPDISHGLIVEAGCGFGALSFSLAKRYPDRKVIAYENSPIPYLVAKFISKILLINNLDIIYGDFWKESFKEASLVVCYLYPKAMIRMKEKCEKELKSGTWLISNTFSIPGLDPIAIHEIGDIYKSKIFFYQISNSKT